LVDLCVSVIVNKWVNYEFDFKYIDFHLKFKVLLSLQQNNYSITEADLFSIFEEDYSYLINEEIEPNDNNQSTLILTSQKQSEEDILRIVFGMSQIKKIPSKVKKKEYRVQTLDKYILPKLQEWWGGKEKLTSDLLSTNFLRKGLQEHLKSVEEKSSKTILSKIECIS